MGIAAVELAYRGAWSELLEHLKAHPEQVNALSTKAYTPLHQAAWHGASPSVIGALMAVGADVSARTLERDQTAAEIALEKHPGRADLAFLLDPYGRSPAQLLRKLLADRPQLFQAYDGNRVVFDRVLECLNSRDKTALPANADEVLRSALRVVAGDAFFGSGHIKIWSSPMDMAASSPIWLDLILPVFDDMAARARTTPLSAGYAVMADLFEPMPAQWGLRGDPFLWREMAHALCHVPMPAHDSAVEVILQGCFTALTGTDLQHDRNLSIQRLARGGMSSAMVCGETWSATLIPLLRQRARWLRKSWTHALAL